METAEIYEKIAVLAAYEKEHPEDHEALQLLADLYFLTDNYPAMQVCAEKLLRARPHHPAALLLLARAKIAAGDNLAAAQCLEQGFSGKFPREAVYLLALCYEESRQVIKRQRLLRNALRQKEVDAAFSCWLWQELGGDEIRLGHRDKAREAFLTATRRASSTEEKKAAYSSFLMCLNYDDGSPEQILKAHKKYERLLPEIQPLPKRPLQQRKKLRIGYISADLYHHAMSYFLYHLLQSHSEDFSVYCYQTSSICDDATRQLKNAKLFWRDLSGSSPTEMAQAIYSDDIDILVELGGHTAGNALEVLAYRPAPLQLCGLGYVNTTGMQAVDYFLTDPVLDPPENETEFVEPLLYLPHTHWSYAPRTDAPDCGETACKKNGFVTFGSFNNFAKITDEVLALWQQILARLPDARLILKNGIFADPEAKAQIEKEFQKKGFLAEQLEFRPATAGHMQEYRDIDIALDPFPYQGGATTCEALYMGVPVITLAGNTHRARIGASILTSVGLTDCIAGSKDSYVETALRLAADLSRLDSLHRGSLRKQMLASPLMRPEIYMQDLENAYKKIWESHISAEKTKTSL